jgi:hypothetical protein
LTAERARASRPLGQGRRAPQTLGGPPSPREGTIVIGLSQLALAVQFQLGLRTVIDFEVGRKPLSRQTLRHLKCALEAAGLEFANGRPSVRLRKVPQ